MSIPPPNGMGPTRPPSSHFHENEGKKQADSAHSSIDRKVARLSPKLVGPSSDSDTDTDTDSDFRSDSSRSDSSVDLSSPKQGSTSSRSPSSSPLILPSGDSKESLSAGASAERMVSTFSFKGASAASETPEREEEKRVTRLVEQKIAHLLPRSLEISKLVEFLRKPKNEETLEALEHNQGFHISKPRALAELGLKSPLEFVFAEERYFSVEPLQRGDQGHFSASGSQKHVSSVWTRGLGDASGRIGYAVRKVFAPSQRQKQQAVEIRDRIDIAYQWATDLADEGVALVASKTYRVAAKLIIIQPYAPSIADEMFEQGMKSFEAIKMLLSLSKAVANLHEKGFVHRDLKPENFSVQFFNVGDSAGGAEEAEQAEEVEKEGGSLETGYFLNDFDTLDFVGTARKDAPIGTPRYMAPEVCHLLPPFFFSGTTPPPRDTNFDLRQSDSWSFGMSALEILFHTDKEQASSSYPAHPFINVEDPNSYALMVQTALLKNENGIDQWIEGCIERQPHLEPVYRLVRQTLCLDPARRISLKAFHEQLQAIVQEGSIEK